MSYSKMQYSKLLPHIERAEVGMLESAKVFVRWSHVCVGYATKVVELKGKELEDVALQHITTSPSYFAHAKKLSVLRLLGECSEDGCVNVSSDDMVLMLVLSNGELL